MAPVEMVRGMTNIFKGRTGVAIAEYFARKGCHVTLLASHPELVTPDARNSMEIVKFRTYDELFQAMDLMNVSKSFDVIVQSAAISDYSIAGAFCQVGQIREQEGHFFVELEKLDQSGKISSSHSKLWLETAPTLKIVDQIRSPWGFKGQLVKFKLQVKMGDEELALLAQKSLAESGADIIVANTLENFNRAIILGKDGTRRNVLREQIPEVLYGELKL